MASTSSNEMDPLQAALDEADTLLNGFSIDSDDEDGSSGKHPLEDLELSEHPGAAATSTTATMKNTPAEPQQQFPEVPPSNGSFHGHIDTAQIANDFSQTASLLPTTPSYDAFRAQTTRFASNLASMAQRGFHQVAATTAQSAGTSPHLSNGSPGFPSPGSSSGPYNPFPPVSASITAGGPLQTSPHVELDKDQKQALIKTHVGDLLKGEKTILFIANLLHVSDSTGFSFSAPSNSMWCCVMTYYRLLLFGTHPSSPPSKPIDWNSSCWPTESVSLIEIPLASMEKVEKSVFSAGTHTLMGLSIQTKDARQVRFTTPSHQDTLRAHESLQTYAFPGRRNLGYLFAFECLREEVIASIKEDNGQKTVTLPPHRKRFEAIQEYQRQLNRGSGAPWAIWNKMNQSFQLCMSYPSILVGPASLDESSPESQRVIRQCAAFRSEGRLPSLTWTSGIDGASIWRSSQPKVGLQGNRSAADELFLKHIMESANVANRSSSHPLTLSRASLTKLTGSLELWTPEPGCSLKILDLRPRSSAMANRTGGYGYENTSNYPGTTLQFCNIANIHAVRDSYQKVTSLCLSQSTSDIQWNSLVEETKWLHHIRLILAASWEAAFWVHIHRMPVLVHCSHGWDRTSQVSAIAQILLDSHYRTMDGFSTLIEKDFMSFGHPFHLRCGHGEGRSVEGNNPVANSSDDGQVSPIFLQFLDCVYQLVSQYPECFEFNTRYLLLLSDHLYSCRFGTFLCDTEREREMVAGIRQRTESVFDYLESRSDVRSPLYSTEKSSGVMMMPLPMMLRNVSLWVDKYCRYGVKPTLRWLPGQRNIEAVKSPITSQENQLLLLSNAAIDEADQQ